MSITRQDRQKLVLDLYYNQGKNIREIAKEARMSFRDIGSILNRADEGRKSSKKEGRQQGIIQGQEQQNSYLYLHKLTSYFLRIKLQVF